MFAPQYRKRARRKGIEAEFSVTFTVGVNGRAADLKFEDGVHKRFQRSVRTALKKWRFEAGTVDGKKQSMEITRVFSFTDPGDSEDSYITGSRLPRRH
ncbi:TonB family protein [Alteromonadaceae bacterium M269]|nr:TonB family protein [Alteromonadaceae bacterium M269]